MNTNEKCRAIIEWIVEAVNSGNDVKFEYDWDGNTLTVVCGGSHTHVGVPDGDFETLVDHLYSLSHGGPGLSWVKGTP